MRRTSIIGHRDRVRERLDNLIREVALHVRDDVEADYLNRLVRAVDVGHVEPRDAHVSLVALRHSQREAA